MGKATDGKISLKKLLMKIKYKIYHILLQYFR